MRRRLLDVTAYTTFDFVDAEMRGPDWTDEGVAVVDVTTPGSGDEVHLDVELDPEACEHVETHADRIRLNPTQARELAAALEKKATAVEEGNAEGNRRRG